MGYELDFLPVGSGDRSGDAVAVRWGVPGAYKVLVYDGGNEDSGEALVAHIRNHYGTNRVDYVVNSHPDADHASGLAVVLEEMEVGELWMHRPWNYSTVILDYFKDGRITDESLAKRLQERMKAAYALEALAIEKSIPIHEPFQGSVIGGAFTVLSPAKDWYVHELIPAFEKSPDAVDIVSRVARTMGLLSEATRKVVGWIQEQWGRESLREDVETSAENESSVVLFADFDGSGVLLTGDAGIQALGRAADFAILCRVDLPAQLKFVQVPHHGSRHNVSSSVLDRIVGTRKAANDGIFTKTAFVSAGKESTTHPRKMVTNAFIRRGAKTFATKGSKIQHYKEMPDRGWVPATATDFSSNVEPWE